MRTEPARRRRREPAARTAAVAAYALLACATFLVAAGAQEGKAEEPRSVVRGRAVYEDTERPVRRAKVMLLSTEAGGSQYTGLTDGRGEFRIAKVPAGVYIVAVDAPGVVLPVSYLSVEELRRAPDLSEVREHFDTVTLDGKGEREIVVRARRGAAVSGRVTYADGDPAVGLPVHVLRRHGGRYVKTPTGMGTDTMTTHTDDRGEFRVAGLAPGEYVFGVAESAEHDAREGRREYDSSSAEMVAGLFGRPFLTTYHPSALTTREAAPVRLAAGDERDGVDIVVPERETRVLTGVVRGRGDKRPVRRARILITSRGPDVPDPAANPGLDETAQIGTWADAQGRWTLMNIPDGPYTLFVRPPESYEETTPGVDEDRYTGANANTNATAEEAAAAAARGRGPRKKVYTPARVEIEVAGADLRDLSVELPEAARISGTVAFEGEKPAGWRGYAFAVSAEAGGERAGRGKAAYTPLHDDTFTLEGLAAGRYFLRASLEGKAEGGGVGGEFYVKSATWKGRDLTREPVEVAEGAAVEGVSFVFAGGAPVLRVSAAKEDKRPAAGALVVIIPHGGDAAARRSGIFTCLTGAAGTCDITAAPGEYAVVVFARVRRAGLTDGELARLAAGAKRVSLRAGGTETVEVVVPDQ